MDKKFIERINKIMKMDVECVIRRRINHNIPIPFNKVFAKYLKTNHMVGADIIGMVAVIMLDGEIEDDKIIGHLVNILKNEMCEVDWIPESSNINKRKENSKTTKPRVETYKKRYEYFVRMMFDGMDIENNTNLKFDIKSFIESLPTKEKNIVDILCSGATIEETRGELELTRKQMRTIIRRIKRKWKEYYEQK